jgi:hypothetical protein
MQVVVSMSWQHVTPEAYEAAVDLIRLDDDPPLGLVSHVAWFTESGLRAVDVWRTRDDFERFAQERLLPAAEQVPGFHGEPLLRVAPLHTHGLAPATADV